MLQILTPKQPNYSSRQKEKDGFSIAFVVEKYFEKWLPKRTLGNGKCGWYPEGEWPEVRTLGDECGFKLRGDKRFAMEKNPLRFWPCFVQREPDKAVGEGRMDEAPASIASSTESTTHEQNRFL